MATKSGAINSDVKLYSKKLCYSAARREKGEKDPKIADIFNGRSEACFLRPVFDED